MNSQVENADWVANNDCLVHVYSKERVFPLKIPLAMYMKRAYANIYVIWILNENELLFVVIDAVVVALIPFFTRFSFTLSALLYATTLFRKSSKFVVEIANQVKWTRNDVRRQTTTKSAAPTAPASSTQNIVGDW